MSRCGRSETPAGTNSQSCRNARRTVRTTTNSGLAALGKINLALLASDRSDNEHDRTDSGKRLSPGHGRRVTDTFARDIPPLGQPDPPRSTPLLMVGDHPFRTPPPAPGCPNTGTPPTAPDPRHRSSRRPSSLPSPLRPHRSAKRGALYPNPSTPPPTKQSTQTTANSYFVSFRRATKSLEPAAKVRVQCIGRSLPARAQTPPNQPNLSSPITQVDEG